MDIQAHADLTQLSPGFDSQAEAWWYAYGALLIAAELQKEVALTLYHPLTWHLPGGTYTPDYTHILADGTLIQVEIKGSVHQKNYRDARSKLRAAAALYPWLTWYEAIVTHDGCEKLERIGPCAP